MKSTFIALMLFFTFFLQGQKNKFDSFLKEGEKKISASYHELYSKKGDEYIKRVFFPELNLLTAEFRFSDKKFSKFEGVQHTWWDNGNPRSVKYYKDDKLISTDTSFHFENGKISSITWRNKKLEYDSIKHFDVSGWLSGRSIYSSDEDFIRTGYDSLGTINEKCTYKNYELIDCEIKQDIKLFKPKFDTICPSNFKGNSSECAEENLIAWLSNNVKYPALARENGITGKAFAKFVIDKEGHLTDIVVMSGICQTIRDEVMRVLKSSPPWIAGTYDGKPVKVKFILPVSFKLE